MTGLSWNFGTGVLSSVVAALLIFLVRILGRRIGRRPLRRFWGRFRDHALIMTTEYKIDEGQESTSSTQQSAVGQQGPDGTIEFNEDQIVAIRATSGYFLSYGIALGLCHLLTFLRRDLRSDVDIIGDKGHRKPREDRSIVILGSPANNKYLQHLRDRGELPLHGFLWELDRAGVVLTLPDGTQLSPEIDDEECGVDYALVASFRLYRHHRAQLVMIAGCNMWGTEAAALFVLDRKHLRALPRRIRRSRSFAFVIRAAIENGHADAIELYQGATGSAIYDLREESFQPQRPPGHAPEQRNPKANDHNLSP